MEIRSMIIRGCIGAIFAIYSLVSILIYYKKRENRKKENLVLSLVCIFVGIFLLGHIILQNT